MRRIPLVILLSGLLGCLALSAYAQDKKIPSKAKTDAEHLEEIHAEHEIDKAIAKGLGYLVSKQKPDGRFEGDMPNTYTALSCMALMAAGQLPGQSKYGENLERGIMYLVRAGKKEKGYFGNEGKARMYGHGICTLALCEAYGMMERKEDNKAIKEVLDRSLKLILYSQASKKDVHHGGWRYEPHPRDSDLSVTVWQVLCLRSAQNCQLDVPQDAIDKAIDYVRRTTKKGQGFAYQQNGNASPAMRTCGCVALLALGAHHDKKDKELIAQSASLLKDFDPRSGSHYWYTMYYLATAANMLGDETRENFLPKLENTIIKMQQGNGELPKHNGHAGGVYSTAFGVICLCVHYQYLPIYQE